MSFQIAEILDVQPEKIQALVSHSKHLFPVIITGKQVNGLTVGDAFQAELRFEGITAWNVIDDFDDAASGIWHETDGIHLLGRVHSVLDYGDGKTIVDVYVQNGAVLFTVDLEAMNNIDVEGNAGLEISVRNLYLYLSDEQV